LENENAKLRRFVFEMEQKQLAAAANEKTLSSESTMGLQETPANSSCNQPVFTSPVYSGGEKSDLVTPAQAVRRTVQAAGVTQPSHPQNRKRLTALLNHRSDMHRMTELQNRVHALENDAMAAAFFDEDL
jgi:hypothetical protein